jgi:hypothetical protein
VLRGGRSGDGFRWCYAHNWLPVHCQIHHSVPGLFGRPQVIYILVLGFEKSVILNIYRRNILWEALYLALILFFLGLGRCQFASGI